MPPASFGAFLVVAFIVSAVVAALVRRMPSAASTDPYIMVQAGDLDALAAWLERGSPDEPDPSGFTLLMSAAAHDQPEAARRLIAAGADLDLAEEEGATALAVALTCAHLEVASILLDAGASPNRTDDLGTSPLQRCVNVRTRTFVPAMLAAGAHPGFRNAWGLTALDIAEREGLDDVAGAIRAAGGRSGGDTRMADVLAELSDLDRRAYRIPRAWALHPDDPRLVAAKDQAQRELSTATDAFGRGQVVRLKFVVRDQPDQAGESVWGRLREVSDAGFRVDLLTDPAFVTVPSAPVVALEDVVDWEVESDGRILGGYTARVTIDVVRDEFGYLPEHLEAELARFV